MVSIEMNNSSLAGEDAFFSSLRSKEYPYLDEQQQVYLDFTGGNLVPLSLLSRHHDFLRANILGNPHSTNPTSKLAGEIVQQVRNQVLEFFRAGESYECIFTANASAALKIVGESYAFNEDSHFVISSDNHNSVNGIREFCLARKGKVDYVRLNEPDLTLDEKHLESLLAQTGKPANHLFAFPAQSNVTGIRHDLSLIEKAHQHGFDVLLDAAAFVPTARLDLSVFKPDFVSISFYKIFGYPTGIGCLLVRKPVLQKLVKPWFAGGTVTLVAVATPRKFLAEGYERFEDGTLSYNMLPAIGFGLDYISSIGMERIGARTKEITRRLVEGLLALRHENGKPVAKIYGTTDFSHRGGGIILNFLDADGNLLSYKTVEAISNPMNISLRTGCFCNPGVDETHSGLTGAELEQYFQSHSYGNYEDMVAFFGKLRGAVRVSVGIPTNQADIDKFLEFAGKFVNYCQAQPA